MKETLSRAELHRRFAEELQHAAPEGSVFAFEIDRSETRGDGCNWYPLASMAHWRGDVMTNLAVFREVRARLSTLYQLDPAEVESPAPAPESPAPVEA